MQSDKNSATTCHTTLVLPLFSRRRKPPWLYKYRCTHCGWKSKSGRINYDLQILFSGLDVVVLMAVVSHTVGMFMGQKILEREKDSYYINVWFNGIFLLSAYFLLLIWIVVAKQTSWQAVATSSHLLAVINCFCGFTQFQLTFHIMELHWL